MSKPIQDALSKLDPTNDNHWTQDGLPRLDTVKILAGDPSLTREAVTAAAPDFNRASAQPAASAPAAPAATPAPAPTEPAPPAPPAAPAAADTNPPANEPPLTAPPMAEQGNDVEELRAALGDAMANLSDKVQAAQSAQQAVVDAQNEVGRIQNEMAKLNKTTDNPIQQYLAQQRKDLEARAVRKDLIRESGLDLKQLAKDLKSPLDAAMERKNTRGASRPARG